MWKGLPHLYIAVFFKHLSVLATLELLRYMYLPDHYCELLYGFKFKNLKKEKNVIIFVSHQDMA